MSLATTTVTWAPVSGDGQPVQDASVTFAPTSDLTDPGTGQHISAEPFTVRPGGDGILTAHLISTDNDGITPAGWAWQITVTIGQRSVLTTAAVPAAPSPVNLDALLPVIPGSGGSAQAGAYLPLAGGTMAGPLILAADPAADLGAATKRYVDASGGPVASVNGQDGTVVLAAADVGADASGAASAAQSYAATAVAAETARAEAAEALALPRAGGTVSGPLEVTGEFTAAGFQLPLLGPSRRVPYRAASSVKTMFQSGHGWITSGTGVGNSNLNDTSAFIRGTQCASVTTAGNGSQAALSLAGATAVDLTGKMIRLTFMVDDVTHLATLGFYAGTSSFGSNFLWNYFTSTPGFLNYVQSGEWVTVCLSWADLYGAAGYTISAAGAPSTKTGFTDMRLAAYDDGAGTATIHYQSVEIVPDTSATFPGGLVSLTFDDSFQSVYDLARPVMDGYGYTGTLYTIQDAIGQPGRLTLPELRSLQDFSGWEVAGHAYTTAAHNAGYETLTSAQVSTELRNLKAWMISNGFPGDSFAYPSGQFGATTDGVPVDQLAAQYFTTGRAIISELCEVWPPPMPLRMKALTGAGSGPGGSPVATLTAAGGILERCAQQGAWLQVALHQVVTSAVTADTQILQSDLASLLAAISGYGMAVLPVSAVTGHYS